MDTYYTVRRWERAELKQQRQEEAERVDDFFLE